MKFFLVPTPVFNTFARTALLAALTGVTINAAGSSRRRPAVRRATPASALRTPGVIPQRPICILNGVAVMCPLPFPDNAPVDTNSDQILYGNKTFIQPIVGNITGNSATADSFTGSLAGDLAGTQADTHVVNVPVSALPSIGFGVTPSAAKIKFVDSDADAADPRMDGSFAHPYQSLTIAAANVHDGDRLILHGNLWGYAEFSQGVTLEGASDHQTVLYGSLLFNGYNASTVRNLRVNCTSDTACINNLTSGASDLILDHVIVAQSYNGAAVQALNGRIVAYTSQFKSAFTAAVVAGYAGGGVHRFNDCDFTGGNGPALEIIKDASVEITGSRITTTGDQPAITADGASLIRVQHSRITAHASAFRFKDSYNTLITGSWLTSGGGYAALVFDNALRLTFAMSTDRQLVLDNYFFTGGAPVFSCLQSAELYSRGNVILDPIAKAGANSDRNPDRPIYPLPIAQLCTVLNLVSF